MINHPIEDLAASVHCAINRDLPMITFRDKDWDTWAKLSVGERKERTKRIRAGDRAMMPMTIKKRHPYIGEVKVTMFVQEWTSGALGFAHKAEPKESEAYTVIVEHAGINAVYFGGRYAYIVNALKGSDQRRDIGWKTFLLHIAEKKLVNCIDAISVYQAQSSNRFGSNHLSEDEFSED
jgi:hypothetical protein